MYIRVVPCIDAFFYSSYPGGSDANDRGLKQVAVNKVWPKK
jgi:hypothetical protein